MFYIGLVGKAGSGKGKVADFFCTDPTVQNVAFADKPKRILHDLYGFSIESLWGDSQLRNIPDPNLFKKGITLTPRKALQLLSTNFARLCYEDTWSNYLITELEKVENNPIGWRYDRTKGFDRIMKLNGPTVKNKAFVVSDTRFVNEFNALQKKNATMIKIYKDGAGLAGEEGQHASEIEQDQIPDSAYDFIIYNNGTLENLRERVERIWNQINT